MSCSGTDDRFVVVRAFLALSVAMGLGRFAFTPILPLMLDGTGLGPEAAATLATANYLGYLAGAVAAIAVHRIAQSQLSLRVSLVSLIVTIAAMAVTESELAWLVLRFVAGAASAAVFVFTARVAHQRVRAGGDGVGWVFGGVGGGIVLSAVAILALGREADWRVAWLVCAGLAAVLAVAAWSLPGEPRVAARDAAPAVPAARPGRGFGWLTAAYFCEGLGYIISATFLVAAVASTGQAHWLGSAVWIAVGAAVIPSCVVWNRLARRRSPAVTTTAALVVQAVAVAVSAATGSPAVQLVAALCFGGTMIAIVMLALGEGARLAGPRAAAILTSVYGLGQVIGPVAVAPLLGGGYSAALAVAAAVLAVGALCMVPVLRAERAR
ncbi:YbfB/YjiJ family MFS transporter [Rhodococcus sp. NPDC058505]|uniref:YbfB/YjiJ family MFS transporter n=1 Tax=unclassified Rhodococcus (in: high G+C Gram-positive bacteria) TaxID=192944 RepID=UPI00364E4313